MPRIRPREGYSNQSVSGSGIASAAAQEPPSTWPADPSIVIENYNRFLPPRRRTLFTKDKRGSQRGERIAIVGRTGAGKSSLVLALMRALDTEAVRPGAAS